VGSLWQFFGLPDPEAPTPRQARPVTSSEPAVLERTASPVPEAEHVTFEPVNNNAKGGSSSFRAPPENWEGPTTPDGEPFHDLGISRTRPPQRANIALRYVVPDEMKRIHTSPVLQRVLEGDTVIVDLRPLVHMESHQMACRRELKHACDNARINAFALDAEDKLLMLPGVATVVDTQKHRLGLQPLL